MNNLEKSTNGQIIQSLLDSDEEYFNQYDKEYFITKDYNNGIVTIEIPLSWWNKQQNYFK